MVWAGSLLVVDIVGVGEGNLEKEVERLQWFGHEGEDMAGSYFEEVGSNCFTG